MASSNIFTQGDLVISVVGDGAPGDSPTYTDNQGSPITLEDISSTTGAVNGTLVLPQTSTTTNGVTQNAISGEYGSSSEGTLELSADGQSLVIAGYGINAATYNAGEANGNNTYGNAALAQTTSVQGGQYTAVPRVVADISANGTVDTSTALYNIYDTQNPRSVATTNGSSFYLSGQGVKGSANQGVFLANDGSSSYSTIYTGVDTRTAELYNGTLYVSSDSSQAKGTGNISSYGMSPTGATTPTPLPGITGKVTLGAGTGNSINNSTGTVDLSPENFFFANATTLYIADSGNPKGGTTGDGGLQKWTFANGTWSLNYTLSAGLNLKANTTTDPGSGGAGTTGLIGLTGQVNTDGTVSLYATNATVGDLNQTYVYKITDTLAATAPSTSTTESFTQLYAAPTDANVRGITFAPSVVCFCSGTLIRTVDGEVAVEDLTVGDLVVTASGAHRPIRWLGNRSYVGRFANNNPDALPVRFRAGSIADGVPARDLYVSPKHAMLLDGALVPAEHLVNGVSITKAERVDAVTYWHVELESHDVLIAEGAEAESYVDDCNRNFFHNAPSYRALYPGAVRTDAIYCAPRMEQGYELEAIRRRLAERAGMTAPSFGALRGCIDVIDGGFVNGWARNERYPDASVCLDVLVDGQLVDRVLANRYRPDLDAVGYGPHAFEARLRPEFVGRRIEVRRSLDGVRLHHVFVQAA